MHDPIVCLISSYREGELIQGALRSVFAVGCPVVWFEGATSVTKPGGPKTDIGMWGLPVCSSRRGEWPDEASKRNAMLDVAREVVGGNPFWILTVDADEILLWGEYLSDWLNALQPGYPNGENVVPMKLTVPATDELTHNGPITWIQPSRLIHSCIIDHYVTGLAVAETPDGKEAVFNAERSYTPPCFGEPHIHHRYYLRRGERGKLRGANLEAKELARNHPKEG